MYNFCYLAGIIAWLTGIVTCIKEDTIALLVVELICFPVGIIHGLVVWLS